jgi:MYXO-CTERM domain-containing protein
MRRRCGLMVLAALAGGGSARASMNAADASVAGDGGARPADAGTDADACSNPCPNAEPAVGDPCATTLLCEYGEDPRRQCNRVYTCSAGAFVAVAGDDAGCPTVLAAGCPATRDSLEAGAACDPAGLACSYAEGECMCQPGLPDAGDSWWCLPVPALVGSPCPVVRPRLGTACSSSPVNLCMYESDCTFESCEPCGRWTLGIVPCGGEPPPPPPPLDGGAEDAGDLSVDASGAVATVDGSAGGDGATGAAGKSGGCGCAVGEERWGAGGGAGVMLGIALLARRRRRDRA